MARNRDEFTYATVHDVFTRSHERAPRHDVVIPVVAFLAQRVRKMDVEETIDRFDALWRTASERPFDGDELQTPPPTSTPRVCTENDSKELQKGNVRSKRSKQKRGRPTNDESGDGGESMGDLLDALVRSVETAKAASLGPNDSITAPSKSQVSPQPQRPDTSVDRKARVPQPVDLMQMTVAEFENLVRRLFEASDFGSWTSLPGAGVQGVMINREPLVGGVTVVRAKRYRTVVSPDEVRELVGAMEETRAGHGILVTTSWFSSGSWAKATANGRVELIDGPLLQHLIRERLGIDVLVAPQPGSSGNG